MMGGMQMQMLARGYLVYEITGSASLLGVVNAGAALPMLGLALFGGAVADRSSASASSRWARRWPLHSPLSLAS